MGGVTHVIGAGLAGLSAATALAARGREVVLHEATAHAGGRCRSYHDPVLDMPIDNGNHIILSGNRDAIAFLDRIGARARLSGPTAAKFPFIDLKSGERWEVNLGDGRLPLWIFSASSRVPGTRLRDYLALLPLSFRPGSGTVVAAGACPEPLYSRLIQPMLLATLNNEPKDSSAVLAAAVIRETVTRGGRACRPMIAAEGLSTAFVDPALKFLADHGATLRLGHKLRRISWSGDAVDVLDFGSDTAALLPADDVIVAAPAEAAGRLLPHVTAPTEFRAIANIHFRIEDETGLPPMIGLINATTQWIFRFPDRISVTISNADGLAAMGREELARLVWSEIEAVMGVRRPMPQWQVVQERRATFATLPEQEKLRPDARTRWKNLFLAGDWVATGLPPTIEGAVRSGRRAAELSADGDR